MLPGLDRVWARPCPVWKSLSLVLSALCLLHAPGSSTPWPPKPSPDPADHMSGASSISIWPHSRSRSSESLLARTIVGKVDEIGDPHAIITPGAESLKLSHGTTTVAMVFDGGIIVAVDSRASMGSFVGSRTTMKVIPVSDHILGTMAGGAADCTFWLRYLGMQAKVFEAQNRKPMAVRTAARMLANTLHGYRGQGLSVGTMLMGHDEEGGAQLFYVDNEGARVKGRFFSVGSGSTYAYSVLDVGYRRDMSVQQAAALAQRAVRHATYRDAFSGGFINIFHVDASGWSKLGRDDSGFLSFGKEASDTRGKLGGRGIEAAPARDRAGVKEAQRGDKATGFTEGTGVGDGQAMDDSGDHGLR